MSDSELPSYEEAQLQAILNNHPQDNVIIRDDNAPPLPRRTPTRRRPPLPDRPLTETSLDQNVEREEGSQKFWKFHIQCFGDDFYLSTNPTMRHLQCRSFPGYFMKVEKEEGGYTLNFEEFESGALIMRFKKLENGGFRFKVRRTRRVVNGEVAQVENSLPVLDSVITLRRIDPKFYPILPPYMMSNYEVKAMDGKLWDVGAIPRVKMKWSLSKGSEVLKYVKKQNLYFHRNFKEQNMKMQEEAFPPVKAVFRPCESKMRKRAMQSINRLLKIEDDRESNGRTQMDSFLDQRPFLKCGDGLHGDPFPKDDDPDHHFKLGWLMIYEDDELFGIPGMFDLVVGVTTTLAYQQEMENGLRK